MVEREGGREEDGGRVWGYCFKGELFVYTVEPPNSGCVGNIDDVPYSEVER